MWPMKVVEVHTQSSRITLLFDFISILLHKRSVGKDWKKKKRLKTSRTLNNQNFHPVYALIIIQQRERSQHFFYFKVCCTNFSPALAK